MCVAICISSQVVGPRHPFRKDPSLDYDVNSDEEWEEVLQILVFSLNICMIDAIWVFANSPFCRRILVKASQIVTKMKRNVQNLMMKVMMGFLFLMDISQKMR